MKEEVESDLDDFPVILDSNTPDSKPDISLESDKTVQPPPIKLNQKDKVQPLTEETKKQTQATSLADKEKQRQKNQELLEKLLIDDSALEYETANKTEAEEQLNKEKLLSISEIIKRRFKNKIQVKELHTPLEVEQNIIKSPDTVNDAEAYSWLAGLDSPKKVLWGINANIQQFIKAIKDQSQSFIQEKQGDYQKLAQKSKDLQKFVPSLQDFKNTGSELLFKKNNTTKTKKFKTSSLSQISAITLDGSYNRTLKSENKRNITLLIIIIIQTLFCCSLTKLCVVPLVEGVRAEHNYRKGVLKKQKTELISEEVTRKLQENRCKQIKYELQQIKFVSRKTGEEIRGALMSAVGKQNLKKDDGAVAESQVFQQIKPDVDSESNPEDDAKGKEGGQRAVGGQKAI